MVMDGLDLDEEYRESLKKSHIPGTTILDDKPVVPHYYGNIVRTLFMAASALLLLSILLDKDLLVFNLLVGVVLIVALTVFAGLTSPRNYFIIVIDTVVAAALFLLYEFFAVAAYYKYDTLANEIFALRQGIAFISLGALYFSIKSLRGLSRLTDEEIEEKLEEH